MMMNQNTMHVINGIQGVIKFVGQGWTPQAIRQEEVNRLLGIEEETEEREPKEEIPFMSGQVVEIAEGPFSEFSGTVEEVQNHKSKRIRNLLTRHAEDDIIDPEAYLDRLTGDDTIGNATL